MGHFYFPLLVYLNFPCFLYPLGKTIKGIFMNSVMGGTGEGTGNVQVGEGRCLQIPEGPACQEAHAASVLLQGTELGLVTGADLNH